MKLTSAKFSFSKMYSEKLHVILNNIIIIDLHRKKVQFVVNPIHVHVKYP